MAKPYNDPRPSGIIHFETATGRILEWVTPGPFDKVFRKKMDVAVDKRAVRLTIPDKVFSGVDAATQHVVTVASRCGVIVSSTFNEL